MDKDFFCVTMLCAWREGGAFGGRALGDSVGVHKVGVHKVGVQ